MHQWAKKTPELYSGTLVQRTEVAAPCRLCENRHERCVFMRGVFRASTRGWRRDGVFPQVRVGLRGADVPGAALYKAMVRQIGKHNTHRNRLVRVGGWDSRGWIMAGARVATEPPAEGPRRERDGVTQAHSFAQYVAIITETALLRGNSFCSFFATRAV